MKVKESLNVTFDETPPSPKTSPLEDEDLFEEEAIEVNKTRPLGNDLEDKSLRNNEIINIKESKSHPVDNVIARLESRILLAYACALDFKLFQMDVKSAFLKGFINKEVYVAQPPGFIDFAKPNHVYRLKKELYGHKQAPKDIIIASCCAEDKKISSLAHFDQSHDYQDDCYELVEVMGQQVLNPLEGRMLVKVDEHQVHGGILRVLGTHAPWRQPRNSSPTTPEIVNESNIVKEEVRDFGITSLGNISLEELLAGHKNKEDDKEGVIDITPADQYMTHADSDLESMPGDELVSVYGFEIAETEDDDTQSQHREQMSKSNELAIENVLDELADMANSQHTKIYASAEKPSLSNPLGHLYKDLSSLTSRLTLSRTFFLRSSRTQSNKLFPSLTKKVKKTLNAKIPELLIKPLNHAFNLLNKKERNRFENLNKSLAKTIKIKVGKFVMRSVRKEVTVVCELLRYYVTWVDKNDVNLRELVNLIRDLVVLLESASALVKAAPEGQKKKDLLLKTKVHTRVHQSLPTPLNTIRPQGIRPPIIIHDIPLDQYTVNLFSSSSSKFFLTPPPKIADKGKGKAIKEDPMKQLVIENLTKQASIRITRNNHPFNLIVYDKFVLKMLEFSEWLEVHDLAYKALKLGIPPLPQLTVVELSPTQRKVNLKRNKRSELIHQVFVKENIVVDGMQRKLSLPEGVVGKDGMVIKEPEVGSFLHNDNFDMMMHILCGEKDKNRCSLKSMVGDLFPIQGSSVPDTFQPIFLEFLKRLTDKVIEVRMSILEHVKFCMLSDSFRSEAPSLIGALCNQLLDFRLFSKFDKVEVKALEKILEQKQRLQSEF
uniref:Retrovirus-related Pol polyprotein from transposon TNT 1-94 n=1 Tax=Tanacetum cinerariifolium TaxID=118510 RepID=A0A6L2MJ19_TANCI|nr:retrovirus-related Pol polyprotein from transposon TNT 1-94 [Tanacetum cinerariifolium]